MFGEFLNITNLFLHAEEINFIHPITKTQVKIIASKPLFWNEFEKKIENYKI
jgi:hypothetical protein